MNDISISAWLERIKVANDQFNKWQTRFKCKSLDRYFEGRQWPDEGFPGQGFVINMIYSTWKTKKPALLFKQPRCSFSPMPGKADWNVDAAHEKAKLATNLVNTLILSDCMEFAENASMCLLDTGSYFGIMEIGYSADWIQNPNAGLPKVNTDYNPEAEPRVSEPEEIPENEWIFVKRIIPERFRVGGNFHWRLEKNPWVGYYDLIRPVDMKPELGKKYEEVMPTGIDQTQDIDDLEKTANYHKVWKIWDLRAKEFFILNETAQAVIYKPTKFKRLPLKKLAFDERRKGAYPIPLFYNWKMAQDDLNESMEQLRAHRRRSKRIFQAPKGLLEQEEVDKFKSLPDGTLIETNPIPNGVINIVPNATVDNSILASVQMSKDNLDIISGISADIRGKSDRVTATQAAISAKAGSTRELSEREVVAGWLGEVCLEILRLAIEKFTLPIWVQQVAGVQPMGTEVKTISDNYEMIHSDELDGYAYKAIVQMDSLSPIVNDEEKTKLLEFLAVLNQYSALALNPTIIRELAAKFGYSNENVIQALQMQAVQTRMAQEAQMKMMAEGGALGSPPQATNMSQKTVEQMQPPDQGQIENQIANQGVPIQ